MRCEDLLVDLVPHARGELDLLPSARMDAHTARCTVCRGAVTQLEEGIDAVRAWEPHISTDEIARLSALVAPEAPRRAPPWWAIPIAAALLLTVQNRVPELQHEPHVHVPKHTAIAFAHKTKPHLEVSKRELAPGIRAIASPDWNGQLVTRAEDEFEISATRGYAVFAFQGGHGRTLRVRAPDLEVEVVGTQLFVEVTPGQPTTVGVISGKVDVLRAGVPTRVLAGTMLRADRAHPSPIAPRNLRSAPYFADRFLGTHASPDLMAVLASAEALVRAHRDKDAEAELADLLPRTRGAEMMLVELDLARVIARDPLRREEAERRLGDLAALATGEVRIQAALLRCELGKDRCAARRCYEAIGGPEAARVLTRTRLANEQCGS